MVTATLTETFNQAVRLAAANFEIINRDSIEPWIDCNHHLKQGSASTKAARLQAAIIQI